MGNLYFNVDVRVEMMVDEHLLCLGLSYERFYLRRSACIVEIQTEHKVGSGYSFFHLFLLLVVAQDKVRSGHPLQKVGEHVRHYNRHVFLTPLL